MFSTLIEPFHLLWRQSAVRLAVQLIVGFGLVLLIGWAALLWFVERELRGSVDQELQQFAESAYLRWQSNGTVAEPSDDERLVAVVPKSDEHAVIGTSVPRQLFETEGFRYWVPAGEDDRFRVLVREFGDSSVVVGLSDERLEEVREILNSGFFWMFVIALAAMSVLAFAAARGTQARIQEIERGLDLIAAGQYNTRISRGAERDDLDRVAASIDHATIRTERLLEQLSAQSANIAHDLRTPLARLRAKLESEFSDSSAPSENVIEALGQTDRIIDTFNALLRIAAVESGSRRSGFNKFALEQLVDEIMATFAPVVEDTGRELHLRAISGPPIEGDRELLVQLLGNLFQNALRHTDGDIELILGPDRIEFLDFGPGIPVAERHRVIEPLYRLDRARQSVGTGLGLAMVRAIADLHDAALELGDRPDGRSGLSVVVQF